MLGCLLRVGAPLKGILAFVGSGSGSVPRVLTCELVWPARINHYWHQVAVLTMRPTPFFKRHHRNWLPASSFFCCNNSKFAGFFQTQWYRLITIDNKHRQEICSIHNMVCKLWRCDHFKLRSISYSSSKSTISWRTHAHFVRVILQVWWFITQFLLNCRNEELICHSRAWRWRLNWPISNIIQDHATLLNNASNNINIPVNP